MDHKLPKYFVLKQIIQKKVEAGEYDEDRMIESERELMETYQLSRITVRKAIDELVNEGILYRIQGKGTYVKGGGQTQNLIRLSSCTEDVLRLGRVPSKKTMCTDKIPADEKLGRRLHVPQGEPLFMFGRVTYADAEPLNYTMTYLPEKIFPGLDCYDLEKRSLYDIIEKEYQVRITKARRTIEAVLPYSQIAGYLEIEESQPVILFHCITYGMVQGKEIPIETFHCYYRTDQYRFYIDQVN